jgi:hypothetical protein
MIVGPKPSQDTLLLLWFEPRFHDLTVPELSRFLTYTYFKASFAFYHNGTVRFPVTDIENSEHVWKVVTNVLIKQYVYWVSSNVRG